MFHLSKWFTMLYHISEPMDLDLVLSPWSGSTTLYLGRTVHEMFHVSDWLPTLFHVAGASDLEIQQQNFRFRFLDPVWNLPDPVWDWRDLISNNIGVFYWKNVWCQNILSKTEDPDLGIWTGPKSIKAGTRMLTIKKLESFCLVEWTSGQWLRTRIPQVWGRVSVWFVLLQSWSWSLMFSLL